MHSIKKRGGGIQDFTLKDKYEGKPTSLASFLNNKSRSGLATEACLTGMLDTMSYRKLPSWSEK